jgi:hypothetical protein
MTDIPRIISWSKWRDPLGRSESEFEYIPEKDVKKPDNDPNEIYDDEEEEDSLEGPTPVVITPMGILPLKPFNDPTKVFNFWLGETTFDITPKVARVLNTAPGVEILDVFTRYKFRIAVGNNFKFQDVRQNIERSLNAIPPVKNKTSFNMDLDDNVKTHVQKLIQEKLIQFNYWAIYICPNGQVDMVSSHEKELEFEERVNTYVNARQLAGGAVFKYDEQLI